MNRKLVGIYLNDHLAGATVGLELVGRSLAANRDTELGAFLEELREQIEYDRRALEELMDRLGIARDRLKLAAAWAGEKAARLKLNGSLTGYSPLSRVVELEALTLGVTGKLGLWQALAEVRDAPGVTGFDVEAFMRRAADQLEGLERHRRMAVRIALADRD